MRGLFHHLHGTKARTAAIGRQLAATIRGPVLWLTLCGGLLVAAIFAGTIMMAGQFRDRASEGIRLAGRAGSNEFDWLERIGHLNNREFFLSDFLLIRAHRQV